MFHDFGQKYEEPLVANAFNVWVDIHAPIGMVFNFLTDATLLNRWWASRCEADPRPGGTLVCHWDGDEDITGIAVFRQFEPPTRLVLEWTHHNNEVIRCDGSGARGMRWPALNIIDLLLIDGDTTRIHLHDMGIRGGKAFAATREATEAGWLETMTRLKRTVEHQYRQMISARQQRKQQSSS